MTDLFNKKEAPSATRLGVAGPNGGGRGGY